MSEPPKFSFGAPASTNAPTGSSLFGNTANAGGGLFGNSSTNTTPTFSFGTAGTAPPTSSSGENKPAFGATTGDMPSNIFGQQSGAGNAGPTFSWGKQPSDEKTAGAGTSPFSGFGNTLQTPAKTNAPTSAGATQPSNPFGASTGGSSSGIFGAKTSAPFGSTTPATATSSGGPSFGGPSTTPAGPPPVSNAFGASTGGSGIFNLGGQPSQSSTIFGAKPAASDQTSTSTSATSSQPAASSGLFGPAPTSTPFSGFGKPAEGTTNASVFSGIGKPAETPKSTPSFAGFGKPNDAAKDTSTPTTTAAEGQKPLFSFPQASSAASTSAATPSLFNAAPASTSGSLFSMPSSTSTDSPAAKPAFQFPSLGASTSAQPATTPAATTEGRAPKSLFGDLGKPKASEAPTTTTAPATSGFSLSAFGKSTSPTQPPSTSTTTTAPSTSTTAPAPTGAPAPQLSASTAGPVPPTQSRLRNKTMDEIVTRWASDLTKYTKEFKTHSETVAHWDQILVENMSKISKLYAGAVTTEKQTASVEMQLAAVENQQNELESWLGKYEAEVDDMLAKNGASQGEMGGPDQERERTYKLAEKLGERLEDMGRDLESMIEDVNGANAGLGKGARADEPITQIVRILNSHLTQLQSIDQGTVALQAKVAAAHKTAQRMGHLNGGSNGAGDAAVEDFYRSYMGRR